MLIVLIALAVVAAIVLGAFNFLQVKALTGRFEAALGGQDAGALESNLGKHMSRVEAVDKRLGELEREYKNLTITNSLASQKISIVRFNPFGDAGGDQSFSLAVLDAHDSGYVLTSIHGRQGTRVYVKPIDFAKSKYTLSAEEQQSLSQAIKRVPTID